MEINTIEQDLRVTEYMLQCVLHPIGFTTRRTTTEIGDQYVQVCSPNGQPANITAVIMALSVADWYIAPGLTAFVSDRPGDVCMYVGLPFNKNTFDFEYQLRLWDGYPTFDPQCSLPRILPGKVPPITGTTREVVLSDLPTPHQLQSAIVRRALISGPDLPHPWISVELPTGSQLFTDMTDGLPNECLDHWVRHLLGGMIVDHYPEYNLSHLPDGTQTMIRSLTLSLIPVLGILSEEQRNRLWYAASRQWERMEAGFTTTTFNPSFLGEQFTQVPIGFHATHHYVVDLVADGFVSWIDSLSSESEMDVPLVYTVDEYAFNLITALYTIEIAHRLREVFGVPKNNT